MAKRRVHLVRHGQSTWDEQGLVQGQVDAPPLTELGRSQAVAATVSLLELLSDRGKPRASTLVTSPICAPGRPPTSSPEGFAT